MNYHKIHNRYKGSIETFSEDASRAGDIGGFAVANMVAAITDGNSASINAQTFTAASESLAFQVNFSKVGRTIMTVTTTYTGSDETTVTLYLFRTLATDGNSDALPDYT